MTRHMSRLTVISSLTIALLPGGGAALRSADQVEPAPAFTAAEIFLELNDTDGDLGVHASIDGGAWTNLKIEGPQRRCSLPLPGNHS
jgi:hypothetical protein